MSVYRPIIGNLYCVMCLEATSKIFIEHEIDRKVGTHIYCNDFSFKKERDDLLKELSYLFIKYEEIKPDYSLKIYLEEEDKLNERNRWIIKTNRYIKKWVALWV